MLNKLERKYGRFAIKNLMFYIVLANAIVYLVDFALSYNVTYLLVLIPSRVLAGEFWRLISFIAIPPEANLLFIFFVLYLNYIIGMSLEHQWGSFKMNVYYLIGLLTTIIVSFIGNSATTGFYLNTSLFLAYAKLFPENEFMLFFILPVKVKWLGWLTWAGLIYSLFVVPGIGSKLLILAPLLNYFIFFGKDIFTGLKHNRKAYQNRTEYKSKVVNIRQTVHKCTICGITEKDDPNMEFRYCSKCSGDYEYCMEHLKDHEHR